MLPMNLGIQWRPLITGKRSLLAVGCWCVAGLILTFVPVAELSAGDTEVSASADNLAAWIDSRFAESWPDAPPIVDDATFLRRVFFDLVGSSPSVAHAREFFAQDGDYKRAQLVDRLLHDQHRPDRFSERMAANFANNWRRSVVMSPTLQTQPSIEILESWMKAQLSANLPYDQVVRRLVATSNADGATAVAIPAARGGGNGTLARPGTPPPSDLAATQAFYQLAGGTPEASAATVSRVFLGVRIGCAQCHDHPFAEWKQRDFWGTAAYFAGVRGAAAGEVAAARIKPDGSEIEYSGEYLFAKQISVDPKLAPRAAFATWMTSAENPHFAATVVNRVWQQLLGRGLTENIEDLDRVSASERQVLDELARHFVAAHYDLKWLIGGICRSQLYQRQCVSTPDVLPPGARPVKTLSAEQVFNALEQALMLPLARVDGAPRHNGLRTQLLARLNEAAAQSPEEYRAGIPQTLLLMNGEIVTAATDLEKSRTLRGVLDAPFLGEDEKLNTLFLAVLSRPPRETETKFLHEYLARQTTPEAQRIAFTEIFWGLLNSPEFVLLP